MSATVSELPITRKDTLVVTFGSWQGCSECLIRGYDYEHANGYQEARAESVESFLRKAAQRARYAKPIKLAKSRIFAPWKTRVRGWGHSVFVVNPVYINHVTAVCGRGGEWRFYEADRQSMLAYFKDGKALAYVSPMDTRCWLP